MLVWAPDLAQKGAIKAPGGAKGDADVYVQIPGRLLPQHRGLGGVDLRAQPQLVQGYIEFLLHDPLGFLGALPLHQFPEQPGGPDARQGAPGQFGFRKEPAQRPEHGDLHAAFFIPLLHQFVARHRGMDISIFRLAQAALLHVGGLGVGLPGLPQFQDHAGFPVPRSQGPGLLQGDHLRIWEKQPDLLGDVVEEPRPVGIEPYHWSAASFM